MIAMSLPCCSRLDLFLIQAYKSRKRMFLFFLLRLLAPPLYPFILAQRVWSCKRIQWRPTSFAAPTTNMDYLKEMGQRGVD
jgi:hypothetical protein